jgi:hypothetical protein
MGDRKSNTKKIPSLCQFWAGIMAGNQQLVGVWGGLFGVEKS